MNKQDQVYRNELLPQAVYVQIDNSSMTLL